MITVSRTDESRHHASLSSSSKLPPLEILFGRSERMQEVRYMVSRVAPTDVPVLIQGGSGTGKDLLARLLHQNSHRVHHPFVKVSCPAIPTSLLESELFGYEKGAFTGAHQNKKGRVEQAHRGTILLDEVNSLSPLMQAKLLQVVQEGIFTRVGGHEERVVSTRFISIASDDLEVEVAGGSFRLDLFHRINAVNIKLPYLKDRMEDIPFLIDYFSKIHAATLNLPIKPISVTTLKLMASYHWPGNIRQLENVVRTFILMGDEDMLAADLIPLAPTINEVTARIDFSQPLSLKEITRRAKQDIEREIILKVLRGNGWNRRKTASQLQISYRSLLSKLDESTKNTTMAVSQAAAKGSALRPVSSSSIGIVPSLGPSSRTA